MIDLNKDVKYIKNVGPNRVKILNKLNIFTLKDLITYYPRNHENRSVPKKIADCTNSEEVLIKAVAVTKVLETKVRKLTIYKLIVRDGSESCTITWFNQRYLKDFFKVGHTYNFYGKIETKLGRYEMKSPVFDEERIGKKYWKNYTNISIVSRNFSKYN